MARGLGVPAMGRIGRAAFLALVAAAPALAEEPVAASLLDRCWTPQKLAATTSEAKPARARNKLDLPGLRQEPVAAATPIPEAQRGSIRSVELPPGEKLIALTFDLCEADGTIAGYDGRIVDLLRAEAVKATFFVSGKWMESHTERTAQLLADPNFELGAHGFRHLDMARLSGQALQDENVLTEAAYARARNSLLAKDCAMPGAETALPKRLGLLRFPFGTCNAAALQAAAEHGQLAIQWDVGTGDPDPGRSAKAIAATILGKAHPGAIVVAHANDRGRNTADALTLAIPKLMAEGYRFVTVSELLAAGKPVIAQACYLDHPRVATRVARPPRRKQQQQQQNVFRLFGPAN
jgi:peptidoglycan-N-acetylglucosamine deacetylase